MESRSKVDEAVAFLEAASAQPPTCPVCHAELESGNSADHLDRRHGCVAQATRAEAWTQRREFDARGKYFAWSVVVMLFISGLAVPTYEVFALNEYVVWVALGTLFTLATVYSVLRWWSVKSAKLIIDHRTITLKTLFSATTLRVPDPPAEVGPLVRTRHRSSGSSSKVVDGYALRFTGDGGEIVVGTSGRDADSIVKRWGRDAFRYAGPIPEARAFTVSPEVMDRVELWLMYHGVLDGGTHEGAVADSLRQLGDQAIEKKRKRRMMAFVVIGLILSLAGAIAFVTTFAADL